MRTLGDVAIKGTDVRSLKELNKQLRALRNEVNRLRANGGVILGENSIGNSNGGSSGNGMQSQPSFEAPVVVDAVVGVMDDVGRLQMDTQDRDDAYVHLTKTLHTTPSSYFLDLRGVGLPDLSQRRFTADWLILHDNSSPWKTIALANIDVTNDISTAGPIPNGRDEVAQFTYRWTYFFVIYNSSTQEVASLSSNSSTAPTLPSGYDYFVRVGSAYTTFGAIDVIDIDTQLEGYHWDYTSVLYDNGPISANTYEALDLSGVIPPTAKRVIGYFGRTSGATTVYGMGIASTTSGQNQIAASLDPGAAINGYGLRASVFFDLPILESQTMYWKASSTGSLFGLAIHAYIDDI